MLFLKSGENYWDGKVFQPDYHKAILFGGAAGTASHLKKACKQDPECKIVPISQEQLNELNVIHSAQLRDEFQKLDSPLLVAIRSQFEIQRNFRFDQLVTAVQSQLPWVQPTHVDCALSYLIVKRFIVHVTDASGSFYESVV